MAKLYNLARMTTATTGGGIITLAAPVSSFLSFAQAGAQDGDELTYAIDDAYNREIGRGVYNAAAQTLTRNVLRSTNNDTPIDLSGKAQVSIAAAAEDLLSDANADGRLYGRRNGAWDKIVAGVTTYTGIDGPTDPNIGDLWYNPSEDTLSIWDGANWNIAGASDVADSYLPLSGGALTGPLQISATRFGTGVPCLTLVGSETELPSIGLTLTDYNSSVGFWAGYGFDHQMSPVMHYGLLNPSTKTPSEAWGFLHRSGLVLAGAVVCTNGHISCTGPVLANGGIAININNAWKPGGGLWSDSSDARIKNIESSYHGGLAEIEALQPMVYTFKGNDEHHALVPPDQRFIGLIGQDVEPVMPEMVSRRTSKIDGRKVNDERVLDQGPLIFALINAVKELSAKVRELENVRYDQHLA